MILKPFLLLSMLLLSLLNAGCADSKDEELHNWMVEQRNAARPKVVEIAEPKLFVPQAYAEVDALDPFSLKKLSNSFKSDPVSPVTSSALITPELSRRKEQLESFPLDAMSFVDSLKRADKQTALLRVDKLIYQVNVGSHIGQNYGKITKISETELSVREIVQDAAGEWIERQAVLQLQEGTK